jgi:hypothetical protein
MLTYKKIHFFSTPFFPELVQITHVMHLAAQLLYAMQWRIQAHMCGATLLNW